MVKISASRRDILGGAAAAVAAPAVAAQSSGPSATPVNTMQDPTGRYPKPPFPRQPQPWPGLASKMQPLPDHGEKSYRGSGRLMGRKAVAIPGDIRDPAFCRKLVANAVRELGGLDILVNNAGRQQSVDNLAELDDAAFDWTMKTNIYAPFWITKAALPHLKPGSAIIITASVQAFQPSGNLFDYAQTKAANVAFAKSLAKQLGPKGIRVNAVAPGPFWTPLQPSGGQPVDAVASFGENTPLGRPGQPAELAATYVTLAAPEQSYATGQVFGASGGTGVG